jgi:hypothetical protein
VLWSIAGGDEDVNVIGHDGKRVESEFAVIAVTEESGDEELRVGVALEVAMLLEG